MNNMLNKQNTNWLRSFKISQVPDKQVEYPEGDDGKGRKEIRYCHVNR